MCIADTQRDIEETGIPSPIVGHVGDGNFHLVMLVDRDSGEEMTRAKEMIGRLNHRAIAMGGTCTGEHGVGIGKMDYLTAEHGDAVSVMRSLKKALDPDNIMNPGKILRV